MVKVSAFFQPAGVTPGEKLCLQCGLCCDGTLFDNVRFKAKESPARLKKAGIPVLTSRAKVPLVFVRQPCAALCSDCTCRVYADRPSSCREFECRVYKDTLAGDMPLKEALKWIRKAQRLAVSAKRCLEHLGDENTTRSLHDRFRSLQRRVERVGATGEEAEHVSKLALLMHQLHLLAHARFHTRPDEKVSSDKQTRLSS